MLGDLLAALMLLTRLPVARFAPPHDALRLARCAWAFPVVGLVVGGLGSLTYLLAHRIGLPPLLAAAWTVGAMILLTGGMHDDGLADTADGFGGGATPARKLEIMRDSRIGSYGALALAVSIIVRTAALASLAEPKYVAKGLVLAGILGRAGMLGPLLVLVPARADGLASALKGRTGFPSAFAAFAVAAAVCLLCLTYVQAMAIMALTAVTTLGLASLARAHVGGYTGDVLGACETITECVILTALVPVMK